MVSATLKYSIVSFAVVFAVTLRLQAAPFTQSSFEDFLTQHQATSIEESLALISKHAPEFQSNYVLFHHSRSIQHATPHTPRVVAFSDDAKFIFAFTGDASFKGGDHLETIAFDDKTQSFQFRRINFADSKPSFGPVNPNQCYQCHGQDLRPNWEPYNQWPGTYASTDQLLKRIRMLPNEEEDTNFDAFVRKQFGMGRYMFTLNLDRIFTPGYFNYNSRRAPNLELTQKLSLLNYQRIARIIQASDQFSDYRFAILGALYDCEDFDTFLPAQIAKKHTPVLADWEQSTAKLFHLPGKNWLNYNNASYIAKLRYLFEGRDIPMNDWDMSFGDEPYNFILPNGSNMGAAVATRLIETYPELEPFRLFHTDYRKGDVGNQIVMHFEWMNPFKEAHHNICNALQARSLAAFSAKPSGWNYANLQE